MGRAWAGVNLRVLVCVSTISMVGLSKGQVSFEKHFVDVAFQGACSVTSGDVDGDGRMDVIGAAVDANEIAWWRNAGGRPILWIKQTIDDGFTGAIFTAAGDVDGDGDTDVLGAAWYGDEVSWWRNDGGSPIQWTKQVIAASFDRAHEVKVHDVDGDGMMDVLAVSADLNEISWWRNDGSDPIGWEKHVVSTSVEGGRSVAACDVDGDGDTDILGAAFDTARILLYRNDGGVPIQWSEHVVGSYFYGVHWIETTDFEGDGDPDVFAAAATGQSLAWWRNDGGDPLTWTKQTVTFSLNGALSITAGDVDGDGDTDLAGAGTGAHDVRVWLNGGGDPAGWTEQTVDPDFRGAWPVHLADLDGDGDMDLISTARDAHRVAWWENDGLTSVEDTGALPDRFTLHQNFPNPFNSETRIGFTLSRRAVVEIRIFDLVGHELLRRPVADVYPPGRHSVGLSAEGLGSGVYFYRLSVDGRSVGMRKMCVLE